MKTYSVRPGLTLDRFKPTDIPELVKHLQAKEIYDSTLLIPSPYKREHAEDWIEMNEKWESQGILPHFAVRDKDGMVIGAAGFHNLKVGSSHTGELGYWLTKPLWGQGIMTAVVGKMVEIGFSELSLARITANIFENNTGSERVLIKNGFYLEGVLRKYYLKEGSFISSKLYACVS